MSKIEIIPANIHTCKDKSNIEAICEDGSIYNFSIMNVFSWPQLIKKDAFVFLTVTATNKVVKEVHVLTDERDEVYDLWLDQESEHVSIHDFVYEFIHLDYLNKAFSGKKLKGKVVRFISSRFGGGDYEEFDNTFDVTIILTDYRLPYQIYARSDGVKVIGDVKMNSRVSTKVSFYGVADEIFIFGKVEKA